MALHIVRRPKTTPVHELERYMRCKDCSRVRRFAYKRSCLVALARYEDFGKPSAVNVVAGGTMIGKAAFVSKVFGAAAPMNIVPNWHAVFSGWMAQPRLPSTRAELTAELALLLTTHCNFWWRASQCCTSVGLGGVT